MIKSRKLQNDLALIVSEVKVFIFTDIEADKQTYRQICRQSFK